MKKNKRRTDVSRACARSDAVCDDVSLAKALGGGNTVPAWERRFREQEAEALCDRKKYGGGATGAKTAE